MAVIYAGTRGYLDNIPVSAVGKFEQGLLADLHANHSSVLSDIATQKKLTDEIEGRLKAAIDSFAAGFSA